MAKLFLFDIDGTLVAENKDGTVTAAQAVDRFEIAIKQATAVAVSRSRDFRGFTDYQIVQVMLQDAGWEAEQINLAMPAILAALDAVHKKNFRPDNLIVLPGVIDLLRALQQKGERLGLLTGKLEPISKRVLEAHDLWQFFSVGGYGSDQHTTRADLITLAVERAHFADRLQDVFVIGDTPLDIQAARTAGAVAVGVANGFRDPKELRDAGAHIVFDDLRDTNNVLVQFGV